MKYVHEHAQYRRNSDRAKVRNRREKTQRRRQSCPSYNLELDERRYVPLSSWTIDRQGHLSFLSERVIETVLTNLKSRRNVDKDRKKDAMRALESTMDVTVTRLCKHGANITWFSSDGDRFDMRISEEHAQDIIDDWQWILDKADPEIQKQILFIMTVYEDMRRYQIEILLDEGSVTYESDLLGPIRVHLRNGLVHTDYIKAEQTANSLLHALAFPTAA